MKLDLSSLDKAIKALIRALDEFEKNPNEFVKDSCIQRFDKLMSYLISLSKDI